MKEMYTIFRQGSIQFVENTAKNMSNNANYAQNY